MIENEAKLAINTLTDIVEGGHMSGYEVVKLMPEGLVDSLEGACYALAQEKGYWSEVQMNRIKSLEELSKSDQDLDLYNLEGADNE